MENSGEYEIGYGKPPKHTRFEKGKSGNPKGRPRKPASLAALLDAELKRKLIVNYDGRRVKIANIEAIAKRIVFDAMKGKDQSIRLVLEHDRSRVKPDDFESDAGDAEALESFVNGMNKLGRDAGDGHTHTRD